MTIQMKSLQQYFYIGLFIIQHFTKWKLKFLSNFNLASSGSQRFNFRSRSRFTQTLFEVLIFSHLGKVCFFIGGVGGGGVGGGKVHWCFGEEGHQ